MTRPARTPARIRSRPQTSPDWRPRWVASVVRSRDQSDGFGGLRPAAGFRQAGAFFFAAAVFGRARVAVTVSTTVTVASPVFTGCGWDEEEEVAVRQRPLRGVTGRRVARRRRVRAPRPHRRVPVRRQRPL